MIRFGLALAAALGAAQLAPAQGCNGGGTYAFPSSAPRGYYPGPAYGEYGTYGVGYSNGYAGGYVARPAPGYATGQYYADSPAPPVVYESREAYAYAPPAAYRYEAPRRYAAPSYYYPQPRRPLFRASAEVNLGGRRACPTWP